MKGVHVLKRNYDNHKRFFKLRDETFDIQDQFEDPEVWRKQLLIMGGHFELAIVPKPEWWEWTRKYLLKWLGGHFKTNVIDKLDDALGVQLQPKSISYEAMDELEFRELFKRVVGAFLKNYAPEMDESTFMRILEFD